MGKCKLGLSDFEYGQNSGSYEKGYKLAGSIECGELLGKLITSQKELFFTEAISEDIRL